MSGELSLEGVEYAINTAGLSPRSHAYVDPCGDIIVKIQVPLALDDGTQVPYGAGSDIQRNLSHLINEISWKGSSAEDWRLNFFGDRLTITVGADVVLPEGHNINSDEHYPLIHQGNDEGRAESVYSACISGLGFDFCSMAALFSYTNSAAIAELLRWGPGHEIIHVNDQETCADLLPHLSKTFPWKTRDHLPFPLRNVDGWVARPIQQEG